MPRLFVQALIVNLVSLTGMAAGQAQLNQSTESDGPVIVGTPRESWKSFEIMKLEAAAEFRWQSQRDSISQTGQPTRHDRENRYRELLDLTTEIAIGHRNLLDLTGTVQLGREDIHTHSETDQFFGHESDTISLYDINALIMGTSSLPTSVFARREQSLTNRPFASSIKESLTEEGLNTRYRTESTASSLQYLHRDNRLTGDFGNLDTRVKQDTLTLQSNIRLTPSQKLDLGYTFDKIKESQAGGYGDAYNRHDASAIHTYVFGEEGNPNDLRSSVRLYNQSGKQSQDHLRWDELLTLRHTRRLETRYSLAVDELDVRGESQHFTRGDASIKYHLFDSLTSAGTVGAQRLSAPGGSTSDDIFANGTLDYTKKVPRGRLDASLGLGFDAQSNSERGSSLHITNEAHVFTDAFPIILGRRNVIAGSVVVTPPAGFPVYQEGSDYTLAIFADHAEIRGVVGGAFVNGQTVLVSYDIGPDPGSEIDTYNTNISIRYTFTEGWARGVALYTTYRRSDHSVRTKYPDLYRLDDVKDLLLGVNYRIAEYDLRYEYNNHDSTFDPYTVHRLQGLYVLPMGPGSSLNVELTHEIINFKSQNNRVTFDRGSLRWNERFTPSLDFNARLEYRSEDSTLNGNTDGFDQIIGVTWRKRQTTIYGSARNSFLHGPGSRQTTQFLEFNLRRAF